MSPNRLDRKWLHELLNILSLSAKMIFNRTDDDNRRPPSLPGSESGNESFTGAEMEIQPGSSLFCQTGNSRSFSECCTITAGR